ncbi:MAG TPA: hypothetical protein VGG99_15945 [Acetobacteraceae bacterium]|jgi:hypothetical protein
MAPPTAAPQDRCRLEHPVFLQVGDPVFRRAETDGTPVMVLHLGDREAALPLRSLQREFGIDDASKDGRMLGLIAASLDFVSALRIGDRLPAEVLTGQASWEPTKLHHRLAMARLQLRLAAWHDASTGDDASHTEAHAVLAAAEEASVQRQVQKAMSKAARALSLPDTEAVSQLLTDLAKELAYIEALREKLLQPVQTMATKLGRMAQSWRGDISQLETLTQVRRLAKLALAKIGERFEQVDGQTGEVMAALRNLESQRTFIRSHRDWLYRTQRAWQPVLQDWETASFTFDDRARGLLARTYHFLAPRFMSVTEWMSNAREDEQGEGEGQSRGMVW